MFEHVGGVSVAELLWTEVVHGRTLLDSPCPSEVFSFEVDENDLPSRGSVAT